MNRNRKTLLIIATLFLLIGAAWAALTYFQHNLYGVTIDPPYLTRPDGALTATLNVQAESPSRVLATVVITNRTGQPVWLYKPLLCIDGHSEEVFYILTTDKQNLKYQGNHDEEYIGGEPGPLPMVLAKSDPELYLQLAPGATHTSITNLATLFDFERNRGKFLAVYGAYMPVVANGRHVYEHDTLEASTNAGPVPVYFSMDSAYGLKGDNAYAHFEVK